jgi:hypothetical protein
MKTLKKISGVTIIYLTIALIFAPLSSWFHDVDIGWGFLNVLFGLIFLTFIAGMIVLAMYLLDS